MKYLLAMLVIAATSATAQEKPLWKTIGKWDVLIDPSNGNGCFAQRQFEDGTTVQMGAVPSKSGGFFAAYNTEWVDIEIGEAGLLKFDFGDALFGGDVVGQMNGDIPGGYAFFDNPNFVTEFTKRVKVSVTGPEGKTVEVDLTGTSNAINGVKKCQDEQPEAASN